MILVPTYWIMFLPLGLCFNVIQPRWVTFPLLRAVTPPHGDEEETKYTQETEKKKEIDKKQLEN